MKTNKIYTDRLLKLAMHLVVITNHPEHGLIEKVSLVDITHNERLHSEMTYQSWLFEELPAVFEEWYFTLRLGNPMCEGSEEKEGTVAAVIDFFDLSLDELRFLFDIEGYQLAEQFGGEILNFESDGPVYARNILALIKSREKRAS
jgi:hypothetical protein